MRKKIAQNVQPLMLTGGEVERLAALLDRPFRPTVGLRVTLARIANVGRQPPALRWKKRKS